MNNIRSINNKTLKKTIFIYFGIFIFVVFVLLLIVSYNYFYNSFIQQAQKSQLRNVNEVVNNLDFYFKELESTLKITTQNEDVVNGLININNDNYYTSLEHMRNVETLISRVKLANQDIDDVIILKKSGEVYEATNLVQYNYKFFEQGWFPKENEYKNSVYFIEPHTKEYLNAKDKEKRSISAVMPVWSIFSKGPIGMVMTELNEYKIIEIISRLKYSEENRIYLVNDKNEIISSFGSNADKYFDLDIITKIDLEKQYSIDSINKEKQLILYQNSKITPWKLVMVTPIEFLTRDLRRFKTVIVLLFIIIVPVIILITYKLSSKIMKPVYRLMDHMENIENGDFAPISMEQSYKEMQIFHNKFNEMINKINQLIIEVYRIELEQKESELRALQQRINPHFLFNSLQIIQSMAVLGKNEEIKNMAKSLGSLFRYIIGTEENMVTIDEEIKHLENYLYIQTNCFYQQCKISIGINKSISKYKIPRLTIQPIVENTFRHAFNTDDEGELVIKVFEQGQYLLIKIWDNGSGISDDRLSTINEDIQSLQEGKKGKHIGLRNVHKRLVLKFGKQYGISIKSELSRWTEITIKIPKVL